jgi:hypothetical protein
MSKRIEINDLIPVGAGDLVMKDVTVYASTAKEARELDHSSFIMGSILFVVEDGRSFMLSDDGERGVWRDMTDGSALAKGGSA